MYFNDILCLYLGLPRGLFRFLTKILYALYREVYANVYRDICKSQVRAVRIGTEQRTEL
jgi:hypothetical protein